MLNGNAYENELEQLAIQIVAGSTLPVEATYRDAQCSSKEMYRTNEGSTTHYEIIKSYDEALSNAWWVGPSGASEVGSEVVVSLSEFVGGIAVANDIHPLQKDIDTVVFLIGYYASTEDLLYDPKIRSCMSLKMSP